VKRHRGETTSDQRRRDSTGTGKNGVFHAFLNAFPDKAKSRITHRRGSCIGDQTEFLTPPEAGNQFRKTSLLIMFMETNQGLSNLQMSQKLGTATGILSNHSITATQ